MTLRTEQRYLLNISWSVDSPWSANGTREPRFAHSPHLVKYYGQPHPESIVWQDDTAIARDQELRVVWLAAEDAKREEASRRRHLVDSVSKAWTVFEEDRRRTRFIEDFGDETLWDAHKKSQKAAPFPSKDAVGNWSL